MPLPALEVIHSCAERDASDSLNRRMHPHRSLQVHCQRGFYKVQRLVSVFSK